MGQELNRQKQAMCEYVNAGGVRAKLTANVAVRSDFVSIGEQSADNSLQQTGSLRRIMPAWIRSYDTPDGMRWIMPPLGPDILFGQWLFRKRGKAVQLNEFRMHCIEQCRFKYSRMVRRESEALDAID
jgi:hypothetical protein